MISSIIAVVQGCFTSGHWSKWHPFPLDSRDSSPYFHPSWSEDGRDVGGLVRGRDSGFAGCAARQSATGTLLKIHHGSCLMCVCGDRHEFECHLFPNVCICIYIYAYDDRYKCCSSYKCSFQRAIATQSSRCRSHPILTGNPL